ncbi:MAG: secretin N-terminal domain-containing protein [Candidatus Eremiobacteraeota bacterium]|nr:secretin N-terminal domain-containing protein [Candidatus Eremiobacteraeota bacterium]
MLKRNEGWKNMILGLLILCFALVLVSPTYASPDATVNSVKVMDRTGTIKVIVDANEAISYTSYRTKTPTKAIVLEVYPAVLSSKLKKSIAVNYGLIEDVRVIQATDKARTVKVIINVVSQPDYKVIAAAGRRGFTVELGTAMISTAKATTAVAKTTATEAPTEPVTKPAVTPDKPAATPKHTAQAQPRETYEQPAYKPAAPRYKPVAKKKAEAPKEKMVTMDFVNADLIYVLKILAKELNLNLVTDPSVSGAVTMTLKNVPATGALNLIIKMSGYDYKKVDSTLIVGDSKVLDKIPSNIMKVKKGDETTQVIPLENAKPGDVQGVLSSNYPDAKIQPDSRLNALIVTADPNTIKQMKTLASQLDVAVPAPPPPKTEIIPLKAAVARDIIATLQKLVPTLTYNYDERLNAIIVTGDDSAISQCKDYLDELDANLKQISLDVKVVDLTETGQKSFGGSWGVGGTQGVLMNTTFTESNPTGTGPGAISGLSYTTGGVIPITYFTRSALQMSVQINALINASEAKVLAAPKVTTISGKEATIHIGEKYPVVYYDPRAGQYQVIYVDIGTKLNITATVLPDGNVSLHIKPDISTLLDLINNQYPHTANRTADVYMRVKDGDTMVLGGLLRETENVTKNRIPLLGDIPIIGQLFKNETRSKSKNEVVIMITPRIMVQ